MVIFLVGATVNNIFTKQDMIDVFNMPEDLLHETYKNIPTYKKLLEDDKVDAKLGGWEDKVKQAENNLLRLDLLDNFLVSMIVNKYVIQ